MSERKTYVTQVDQDPQIDLFIADLIDAPPKSDIISMEFPIFSLSKRLDTVPFRYENPKTGVWIETIPSAAGCATIFDKDLLIYSISQLVEGINRGRPPGRRVRISAYDYFRSTGKGTSGRDYERLHSALARLRGTTFKTNQGGEEGGVQTRGRVFGLIDDAQIVLDGNRMIHLEIVLSEAFYNSVCERRVLTYNREYFALTSPNDRRMYELCRKHCGGQPSWEIGVENLHTKFGSRASLKEFRRMLKKMVREQNVPDYALSYQEAAKGHVEKLVVLLDKDGSVKALYKKLDASAAD